MNNKQTGTKRKFTVALVLLLDLCFSSVQSAMAMTFEFFPASTYSADTAAMDKTLGIEGFIIEDFEDTSPLINGLSLTYTGNGFNVTQSSLPQVLVVSGGWDGIALMTNDPDNIFFNGIHPSLTTLTYSPGASSIGIGLGGFQSLNPPSDVYPVTDHRLYINGVVASSQTLESLAGVNWTSSQLGRTTYLRIDAGPNETITSVGFENIQSQNGQGLVDDGLHFDHLAIRAVPLADVGGSVTGMSPTRGTVTCRNVTTMKTVKIEILAGVKTWNCEQAGLVVNPGDEIKQSMSVTGSAD